VFGRFVVLADALGLTAAAVVPVPGLAPVAVVDVLVAMVDEVEAAVWAAAVVQVPCRTSSNDVYLFKKLRCTFKT
jgi:hypothetical protein